MCSIGYAVSGGLVPPHFLIIHKLSGPPRHRDESRAFNRAAGAALTARGDTTAMSKDFRHVKTTSFLGEGTELEGHLEVQGGLRLDGKLKGSIHSGSVVTLGDTARVEATIHARALISSGRIEGDIVSANHVQLSLPGSVQGSIQTRELILEKGVFFQGSCRIVEPEK
jgi:cytoskeletal protein CcmA (bactofilin family)